MSEPGAQAPAISRAWIFVAVVAAILILGDLNRRMGDAQRLERDAILLQTEVASLEAEQHGLATQIAQATNDVLVENWARGEARMIRPGEHLIIPVPVAGASGAPTPTPEPSEPPPSALEVWWALIVGSGP